jgi:hypothetical protein
VNSRVLCAPDSAISARRDFQTLLRHRELQLAACEKGFTVIGHGSVGAKAEELMRKAWAIEQAGFTLTPRVVLAMGFFDAFKGRNGIKDAVRRGVSAEELWDLLREARFSKDEMNILGEIAKRFKGTPLAIRSSAHGDCRGTGAYESFFCPSNAHRMADAIKKVIYSEFSSDAVDFRRDAGLPAGMAVILEPVFGQVFRSNDASSIEYIFPQCGGNGFTSTSFGKGLIRLVAGLPTQAVVGGGFNVEEGCEATFGSILHFNIKTIKDFKITDPRAAYGKLSYNGVVNWMHGEGISVRNGHKHFVYALTTLRGLGVNWLFERLRTLERLLGNPQYVEWALIDRDGKPEAAILQIADAEPKKDFYEFSEAKNVLFRSNFVVGTGQKVCDGLVFVWNPADSRLLAEYNEKHSNYIVVYAGRLATSLNRERISNPSAS